MVLSAVRTVEPQLFLTEEGKGWGSHEVAGEGGGAIVTEVAVVVVFHQALDTLLVQPSTYGVATVLLP